MSIYPPNLLEDLRTALIDHFAPARTAPDAVNFRITEEHVTIEGLAWAADGALLHTGDRTEPASDLSDAIGEELDGLTEFCAPRFGDTLIVALTPGYTPPPSSDTDQQDSDDFAPSEPTADPVRHLLAGLDDKELRRLEIAVRAVCEERAFKRLSRAAVAALPSVSEEEPFDSASPVARIVFMPSWDCENGDYWSTFADVHHVDGTVTRDVDFDGPSGEIEMALTGLLAPDANEILIIDVPGVSSRAPRCAVCRTSDCRHPDEYCTTSCAVCPTPYTATHAMHPRPGCPGFSVTPT